MKSHLKVFFPSKVDRRKDGKTILKRGHGWPFKVQLEQLKTGLCGKGLS